MSPCVTMWFTVRRKMEGRAAIAILLVLHAAPDLIALSSFQGVLEPPHDVSKGLDPQGRELTAAAISRPKEGGTVVDPIFDSRIRRLVPNHSHVYSQLQSFSHDNRYVILIDHTRGYHVRRYRDLSLVKNSIGWYSAFRWIPGTHTIVALENDPVTFRVFDCDTEQWSMLMRLPEFKSANGPRSYEELSRDGRWTALYGSSAEDGAPSIASVNLRDKRLGFRRDIAGMGAFSKEWGMLEPDWVAASPLGNYVVVQWVRDDTIPASGLELYDIETGEFVRRLYTHHNHGDLGVSPDGREYIATSELASPLNGNFPGLVVHWLDGGKPLHLRPMPWARMEHFSGQGPEGVIIVSAGGDFSGPYRNEIYAVFLDGSIQRLVHHRSSSSDYWVQPKASISGDGSKVIWSSDWGEPGVIDTYVLEDVVLQSPVAR